MNEDDAVTARFDELSRIEGLTLRLGKSADLFGRSISGAFAKGIVEGKRFEDVLRSVGRSMTQSLLKSALKPLESGLSGLLSGGIGQIGSLLAGQSGGSLPTVAPFADGGVIASPAYFPLGRGLGLMGEAGAEAIMPLSRGPDGKLGVRASEGAARPLAVTVQVNTADADSFRRSEAQVAAAVARAVARGSRAL